MKADGLLLWCCYLLLLPSPGRGAAQDDGYRGPGTEEPGDVGVVQLYENSEPDENRPVVSLCCEPGLHFRRSRCHDSPRPLPELEFPPVYTEELLPSRKQGPSHFRRVYRYPCWHGSFGIDPFAGECYLLEDGSVLAENQTRPSRLEPELYCLALVLGGNGSAPRTLVAACLPSEGPPKIYSVCSVASAICLAATYFVYSALQELRNIHGYVVKAHVAILTVAYLALSLLQLLNEHAVARRTFCACVASMIKRFRLFSPCRDLYPVACRVAPSCPKVRLMHQQSCYTNFSELLFATEYRS